MLVRNAFVHDSRVEREASTLAGAGYDVLLLAQAGTGLPAVEHRGGVRVRRLASATAGYYAAAVAHGLRFRPKVVHCHDLDTLLPGALVAKTRAATLVFDAHELWTERASLTGGAWSRLHRGRYRVLERLLIGRADAVITVSDGIKDELVRRYRITAPTVLLNTPSMKRGTGGLRRAIATDAPVLLYVGGIQPHRGLEVAVAALAELREVVLVLLGPAWGATVQGLQAQAVALGVLERLQILPPVPPADVTAWAADADVGLCVIPPVSLSYRLALPNKLFEYALAGLPVVASDAPEIKRYVSRFHLGITVAAPEPQALAAAVRALLADRRGARVHEPDPAVVAALCWELQAEKLNALYARLRPGLGPSPV
ncbi:MAG: glycosyltransferase [Deltaproteobacteria bacterium]|nr:glycosyltransferase [Deltaproteobacteria bacterium]